ncbi:hypothetical protein ACWF94_04540 [Streptomyces sp. NPDC055078]
MAWRARQLRAVARRCQLPACSAHRVHCLRIRLAPGDGCIAPTELLPHDGSTTGIDHPSVAAFWLGHPHT